MIMQKKKLLIGLLMVMALIQVVGPTAAQSNTIDNVVVSVPVCNSPNGGSDGRLAVTFTIDGQSNRTLSNTLSGISANVIPPFFEAGTHTENYQYFAPEGTAPGSILTVTVMLGTNYFLGDLDTETFSFNCSTGEKVGGPVAPFPLYDSAFTPFQTPVTINVLFNDIDTNGDLNPASTAAISGPVNGALANNGDGTFIYTPNDGYSGLDEFTYQVCDTTNLCGTAPVRLQVGNPNRPPVANDDLVATPEGAAVSIYAATNDSDPDETSPIFNPTDYTFGVVSNPSNGVAVSNGGGFFTYTPNSGFNGVDTFTYQLCDSGNLCDNGLVTIQIQLPPAPPVAVNDYFTVRQNETIDLDVAHNDTDPNNNLNPTSAIVLTFPTIGYLSSGSFGVISYGAPRLEVGTVTFTYQICDTTNLCSTATATIEIVDVVYEPVAREDKVKTQTQLPVTFNVATNDVDTDDDLDLLSATIITGPTNGAIVKNSDGTFTYTSNANFVGTEILTYQICDLTNLCVTSAIIINVDYRNDPPVANNDSATTFTGVPVIINAAANDSDPDGNLIPSTAIEITGANNGRESGNRDGTFTYTPNAGFVGVDSFMYKICDGQLACSNATITITVLPVGNPPIANNDSASTPTGVAVVINVASNDTDSDGNLNPNSVGLISNPTNGNVFNNGNGSFSYTPNNGFSGTDSLTYQICDTDNLCASATVTIEVTAVVTNNPPDCSAARPTSRIIWPPLSVLMIPIQIRGVSDADGDRVKITITGITQNEAERGLFRGDRAPDSFGVGTRTAWLRAERDPKGTGRIYSIAFSADDGNGGTCTGTVAVTVPRSWGR